MSRTRSWKSKMEQVHKLWQAQRFDEALSQVEEMRATWPGNAQLLVLWASLVQMQENPASSLAEVKAALQQATDLEAGSPTTAIELGHFLDAVEDNPGMAAKYFAEAAFSARRLLIEALLGQTRSLLQLGKKTAALQALAEAMQLANQNPPPRKSPAAESNILFDGFAPQIESLLQEMAVSGEVSKEKH